MQREAALWAGQGGMVVADRIGYQNKMLFCKLSSANKLQLSGNALKLIAVIAMTIDHLAWAFLPLNTVSGELVHMMGRITAPVMCYLAAEGLHYTKNPLRYLLRLLLFACIAHIPYVRFWKIAWYYSSVLWGITLGVAALWLCKQEKVPFVCKLGGVLLACLLAVNADWNYIAVLWIVLFGLTRGNFGRQAAVLIGIGAFYVFTGIAEHGIPYVYRFGVLLALPLLARYNHQRGKKTALSKWGFYWYYPVHLFLLAALQSLL